MLKRRIVEFVGEHIVRDKNVDSLHSIPETNITDVTMYINYTNK